MGKKAKERREKHAQSQQAKKVERKQRKAERKRKHREKYKLEDDENFPRFQTQLRIQGLRVQEVEGDGNCYFRALSDQLYGNEHRHMELRQRTIDHIVANKDYFLPFFDTEEESFEEANFNEHQYVSRMRENGEWAGNEEVQASSLATKTNIVIHQLELPTFEVINFPGNCQRVVLLSYHNEDHYNSVRPLDKEFVPIEDRKVATRPLATVKETKGIMTTQSKNSSSAGEEWEDSLIHEVIDCYLLLSGGSSDGTSIPLRKQVESCLTEAAGEVEYAASLLLERVQSSEIVSEAAHTTKKQQKLEKPLSRKEKKKEERREKARKKWAEEEPIEKRSKHKGSVSSTAQKRAEESQTDSERQDLSPDEVKDLLKTVASVRI